MSCHNVITKYYISLLHIKVKYIYSSLITHISIHITYYQTYDNTYMNMLLI